jgi:hypothetical protein
MQAPIELDDLTWVRPDWREALLDSLHRLERMLEGVQERAFRRTVVRDALQDLSAEALVATLVLLVDRAKQGNGRARAVLQELALEPTVYEQMPYARVQSAYALARAHGCDDVARMFISALDERNPTADEAFTGNDHMDAPAGVRRSAARSTDRFKLDRLVHDRDHRVIAILLDNPRVTERDVVKIAAMRPTRPEVLTTVARHRRWSSRYRVRKAICLNPSTPAPIARRLVPTLMRQDLVALLDTGGVTEELRTHARDLLAEREESEGRCGPYQATVDLSEEQDPGDLAALLVALGGETVDSTPG